MFEQAFKNIDDILHKTGETAFLFLQHFIRMLKAGGRGGVVIKNTFLTNTDNTSVSLRKLLPEGLLAVCSGACCVMWGDSVCY